MSLSQSHRPFSRADIARIAAEDAAYGLRYIPPQPAMPMPIMPYFMPQLYAPPPTHSLSQSVGSALPTPSASSIASGPTTGPTRSASTRSRANSIISNASRMSHPTNTSTRTTNQPLATSTSANKLSASTGRPSTAASKRPSINKEGTSKITARERRGSKDLKQHPTLPPPSSQAPSKSHAIQPLMIPELPDNIPPPSAPPSPPQSSRLSIRPPVSPTPSSPVLQSSKSGVRSIPTTPRTPRSGASSRIQTPRATPRPAVRRLASRERHGNGNANNWKDHPPSVDPATLKSLVHELLQEELSRVQRADEREREESAAIAATRATRRDLIAREEEERQRRLEEETRRPNYYIHQAKSEVKELKSQLLPLLSQADAALDRLYARVGVNGPASSSLLSQLSAVSAQSISSNADQLGDLILDDLLADTIATLNRVEEQKARDRHAHTATSDIYRAWEMVEAFEAEREAIEKRWRSHKANGAIPLLATMSGPSFAQQTSPHLPVIESVQTIESTFEAPAAKAPQPYSPPTASFPRSTASAPLHPYSLSIPHPPQATSVSSSQSIPPVPSLSASNRSASSLPTLLSSVEPSVSTNAPYHRPRPSEKVEPIITPTVDQPTKHLPTPLSVSLPSLPDLVAEVESHRAAFDKWQTDSTSSQFLQPHQLHLHTLVAAASDEILEDLIASTVEEVGKICDGYVERVFEAEFEVDLLAENDPQ